MVGGWLAEKGRGIMGLGLSVHDRAVKTSQLRIGGFERGLSKG